MNYRLSAFEIIRSLLDFLFPPACPGCGGTLTGEKILCPGCKEAIAECSYNYYPSTRIIEKVENVSVLLPYDTHCRNIIHSLKYHSMPSVGLLLGELMGRKAVKDFSLPEHTLLVPVPLHPSKLRERGYNQSERLAQGFASFTGYKIAKNILARTRETPTQTALDSENRVYNVKGAFRYTGKQSLMGCPVIIIDDVMTTGSTVSECVRTIKGGGAGSITVCVAAVPEIGKE